MIILYRENGESILMPLLYKLNRIEIYTTYHIEYNLKSHQLAKQAALHNVLPLKHITQQD